MTRRARSGTARGGISATAWSGISGTARGSGISATARGGVSGIARVPSGDAILGPPLTLSAGWRVGGFTRGHGTVRPERSAGSHAVARRASVARRRGGVARRWGGVARRRGGVARRRGGRAWPRGLTRSLGADSTWRHAVTARHRVAGSRRLPRASVVARHGRHGRHRLAARAVRRPARTTRVHTRRVAMTRRLRASPARGPPVLAPPAGPGSRIRGGSCGAQDLWHVLAGRRPGSMAIPGHVDETAR